MDDLKCLAHNSQCQHFLAIVSTMLHQSICQTLNNGALWGRGEDGTTAHKGVHMDVDYLGLPESLHGISSCCVWEKHRMFLLDSNVVLRVEGTPDYPLSQRKKLTQPKGLLWHELTANEMSSICTSFGSQRPKTLISTCWTLAATVPSSMIASDIAVKREKLQYLVMLWL